MTRSPFFALLALGCSSNPPVTECKGCLDNAPRFCNSQCETMLSSHDGGPPYNCACVANPCDNGLITFVIECDDNFCQCSAPGATGYVAPPMISSPGTCEGDVSKLEPIFAQCMFPSL